MATFYVLPPRASLEGAFGDLLGKLFPGLPLPVEAWESIAERIGSAANWPDDVFLVPRDDLPEGEPVGQALAAAFGAEAGDRIVEVSLARGPAAARMWILPTPSVPGIPAAL
jgi:hypothetical protein